MWRILLADWRRTATIQGISWAVLLIILSLIRREYANECCPELAATVLRETKWLFLCLLYAQMSLVWWTQVDGIGGFYSYQRIVDPLPLSVRQLNRIRLAQAGLYFVMGAVAWIPVLALWRHYGRPVSPWMVALSGLLAICFLLWGMRNRFPRVFVPFLVPILFVPSTEQWVRTPLQWATQPWPTILLTVVALVFAIRGLGQTPPRWAQR